MFEKILLPMDFSPDSERVLEYVREIPGAREVILLHVVDATRPSLMGKDYDRERETAQNILEERQHELEKNGIIRAEIVIETIANPITQGDVPLAILEIAETERVSLIMMGARGRNTIQNILLGSVSANVIRRAKIPILLMRFPKEPVTADKCRNLFSRVLVPLDFSQPSKTALSFLQKMPMAGPIILLHVVDRGESEIEIKAAVQKAHKNLDALQNELTSSGITAETRVQVGYPPEEINATAERDDVSLILMSPLGEGWTRELRSLFIGSTTNAVMRRAHRPVLIAAGVEKARADGKTGDP